MRPLTAAILFGVLLGLFGTIGGVVSLDAFAAYQERESYHALITQRDSLEHEVELCRISTNRIAGRLTTLERLLPRRRR